MHALLAHAYHLAQHASHVLTSAAWRAPAACLAVAACCRLLGFARSARGAAMTAALAMLAGWLLLAPHALAWRPPPIARLPGLAALLLAEAVWCCGRRQPIVEILLAAVAAWWLRGAPLGGPGILDAMPVFLGLAAGLAVARRLAYGDRGWGNLAAALALAVCLPATGAAPHWSRAALLPAIAALVLLGLRDAAATIAGSVVVVAAAAMMASDRGRLVRVDLACLAPLLAWGFLRVRRV